MRKISQILIIVSVSAILALTTAGAAGAQANDSLVLSITPPLFKVNMSPGETWSSSAKIVNNNNYEMTVYAQVVDFKSGETGGVELIDQTGLSPYGLGAWLEITAAPIVIPPSTSAEIPFKVKLPADASPGGHYAAILIGSRPPTETQGSTIKIASKLASLLLVRVSGQVVEQGAVREFSVSDNLTGRPAAKLKLRFANTGNVHLQPQGEIKIYNLFGQVRSTIPIAQKSADYGNVLPGSDKIWQFGWRGDSSLFDAGRLKAELALSFGEEAKQSEVRTIYFWTFNLKPTLVVVGSALFIILLIYLLIRRLVRRSVAQAKAEAGLVGAETDSEPPAGVNRGKKIALATGVTALLLLAGLVGYLYYNQAGDQTRNDEGAKTPATDQVIPGPGGVTVTDPEETASSTSNPLATSTAGDLSASSTASTTLTSTASSTVAETGQLVISMLNGSGVTGLAGEANKRLIAAGFTAATLGNADNFDYATTSVSFGANQQANAREISRLLGASEPSQDDNLAEDKIVVVLGKDFK